MLWRCEVKKMLLTHRGLLLLSVCLVLKVLFLSVFPEQKDARILLSQRQYDKYLAQLYGENTPEKSEFILTEYENFRQIIGMRGAMQDQHASGAISDEAWQTYARSLDQANLRINSAKIFAEKAEQFAAQSPELPPAHYIYEYGWQTIFTLQNFPDIFLIFGLLMLAAQCFSAEAAGGMLPVLLAAKNGRRKLYGAKLLALLTVSLAAAVVSGGLEALVFFRRGWLRDGMTPLYSITLMADCPLVLSLHGAYLLCLGVRTLTALLFAGMIFSLSLWLRSAPNLIFSGLCILLLPLVWNGAGALFTHGGLLCGSRMLLWLGASDFRLLPVLAVVAAYSAAVMVLAEKRHRRGL